VSDRSVAPIHKVVAPSHEGSFVRQEEANQRSDASPSPEPPPVTIATFPFNPVMSTSSNPDYEERCSSRIVTMIETIAAATISTLIANANSAACRTARLSCRPI